MSSSVFNTKVYAQIARRTQAEGIVMLENRDKALPLAAGSRIALFGRSQFQYYKSGTGSGGMVNTTYVTGVREAILERKAYLLAPSLEAAYEKWLPDHPFDQGSGWGTEPWFQEEMEISPELAARAAQEADAAVVIIGRTAGEDKDNKPERGSYYLTETEETMLRNVCAAFSRTIVLLNVGNIIDMNWVSKYAPSAVLYIWQGGQEGGNGVLDVLTGEVSPSGKLTDTIAEKISDYPSDPNFGDPDRDFYAEDIYVGYRYFETFAKDKVLYPFGFGLSYTTFEIQGQGMESISDTTITFRARVLNTGSVKGKEVVQIYCEAPQGELGKPARSLCAYRKTILLDPGQSQDLKFKVPVKAIASYDDGGVTGNKSCWVLEGGTYNFHIGNSVRSTKPCGSLQLSGTAVIEQLEEAMAPIRAFDRIKPVKAESAGSSSSAEAAGGDSSAEACRKEGAAAGNSPYAVSYEPVPLRTTSPLERRAERLPQEIPYTGDRGYRLIDVADGKVTMETFLAQLTDEDLICLTRGEGMCSPKVTPGTAAAFGGVTDSLLKFGIPLGCCSDGPSGIRMDSGAKAFSMPSGTCQACTWNNVLIKELYDWEGMELRKNRIDSLLGPGMNIHRHPLNGRNFEYFSEDPFLTGKMAVMQLRGMRESAIASTIKHFCANNQEYRRMKVDSVISERALREIYLRGFEMAVREGAATSVMTTYGSVNGAWTASQYDLLTTILRGQFGFGGIVMTDWWAAGSEENGPESIRQTSTMIRAQNDLYMVTFSAEDNANGDDTAEGLKEGRITRGELQRAAYNICRYLMDTPAFLRLYGIGTDLDAMLDKAREEEAESGEAAIRIRVGTSCEIPTEQIRTERGATNIIEAQVEQRGTYLLELEARSELDNSLAQIPMTVSIGSHMIGTVSLNGAQTEWTPLSIQLPAVMSFTFYLKLFFAQGGMGIRGLRLSLSESSEGDVADHLSGRQTE